MHSLVHHAVAKACSDIVDTIDAVDTVHASLHVLGVNLLAWARHTNPAVLEALGHLQLPLQILLLELLLLSSHLDIIGCNVIT